eukprot:scaffold49034_cov25-Prasinocladus_malaysianus.AAC.1
MARTQLLRLWGNPNHLQGQCTELGCYLGAMLGCYGLRRSTPSTSCGRPFRAASCPRTAAATSPPDSSPPSTAWAARPGRCASVEPLLATVGSAVRPRFGSVQQEWQGGVSR